MVFIFYQIYMISLSHILIVINLELEKNNIETIIDDTDENFSSKIFRELLINEIKINHSRLKKHLYQNESVITYYSHFHDRSIDQILYEIG